MLRAMPENGESSGGNSTELGYVLRLTTSDDLNAFLVGTTEPETAWLSPASQLEEAWFLGLRLNGGVDVSDVECEFGAGAIAAALRVVARLEEDGLLIVADNRVRLTPKGRLLSNEVFQEFLGIGPAEEIASHHL
jgi:oxygen-independent coproporphyrinogen-3 oxidase